MGWVGWGGGGQWSIGRAALTRYSAAYRKTEKTKESRSCSAPRTAIESSSLPRVLAQATVDASSVLSDAAPSSGIIRRLLVAAVSDALKDATRTLSKAGRCKLLA
jgi:hypothetical protein